MHRRYAEAFGTHWRILSAWYGITHPDQLIEDYDARFRESDLAQHRWWRLQGMFQQARALPRCERVVLLGGSIYRRIARHVLQGIFLPAQISEPFAGLNLLVTLRTLKATLEARHSVPERQSLGA
jgi:hypothetical protein